MQPLISVIIPVYLVEEYIQDTIYSILSQTFKNFEIIVVDDGSTDGTSKKVLEIKDPRIRYHFQKRSGRPACARNKGISLSKGEYIAFIDGDDLWFPQKLEKQIECIKKNKELGIVFTNAIAFDDEGDIEIINKREIRSGMIFKDLFMRAFIITSTVMLRRKCLEEIGCFNENPKYRTSEDYDLWLRISLKYPILFINEPLAKYRIRKDGISGSELERIIQEINYFKLASKYFPVSKSLILMKKIKYFIRLIFYFWKNIVK